MKKIQIAAIDLGASSGRVMLGSYDGTRLAMTELYRFPNEPVVLNGTMYWDFLRLFHEIKKGLSYTRKYGTVDSLGVDTWGVDFGLLDRAGNLMENPVHYRDARTSGIAEKVFGRIGREELYHRTGNQIMEINTMFQLFYLAENRSEFLERADMLLMMPDLIQYFLSGVPCSELSIASTSQLMDARTGTWSVPLMERLGIPKRLFREIILPAARIGPIKAELCEELGVEPIEVIAVAGHDTQCAMAAVPAKESDFIFISCGTWALVGTELPQPVINQEAMSRNVTNEKGCENKTSFLKNITGTWLIQESRRHWAGEGQEYSFAHLEQMAERTKAFQAFIDPDAPEFMKPGNIPGRIRKAAERTGQKIPQTEGAVIRCIHESLALKYRMAIEEIEQCTGREYHAVYMVGGGAKSRLLCQMTANACGRPVTAGPAEATIAGNMGIQLMALGAVSDQKELRRLMRDSFSFEVYEPKDTMEWERQYIRFREQCG